MKDTGKAPAKLKHFVEDFIVEEIGPDWDCNVSDKFIQRKAVDLSGLEENESRDFLAFELEKKNLDHFQMVKDLARGLGKGVHAIGYAGSKDKKAWTCQRISVFKPDLEILKNFSHPNIYLKNIKWAKRKIKMGYLVGNRFRIVLRDLDKKDAMVVGNRIRKVKAFPNYFGPQRFGSLRGNNVKIGKLILKKKFKDAVWTILTDSSMMEREDFREVRERLRKEKDFSEAEKYFPTYLKLEMELIRYLIRKPEDWLGALKSAERKNLLMYIHSVQSKIFNDILEMGLDDELDFSKEGQRSCPLMGFKTRFSKGRLGEFEQEILSSHGLELSDFDLKEIPYLRMKGSFRKALVEVSDLGVSVEDDEEFSGSKKMILSFVLPSGVYATTFLDQFFALNE
jgi:tRNA pseudouridine13 synthase